MRTPSGPQQAQPSMVGAYLAIGVGCLVPAVSLLSDPHSGVLWFLLGLAGAIVLCTPLVALHARRARRDE